MPAGSYLMTSSFSYRKLKKLPSSSHREHDVQQQSPPRPASIQDYYHSYYRALGAAVARRRASWKRRRQGRGATTRAWGRRRGPRRLRISSLARALRRKAAAAGGRVRASVTKVAARLMEGRPYIGDLFAGNYMFMQVAPSSPTMADKEFAPFTEYYYGKVRSRSPPPAAVAAGSALQQSSHPAAAAGGQGVASWI